MTMIAMHGPRTKEQLHEETVLSRSLYRLSKASHSMHEIAVSISQSPQRSLRGLVLAETRPVQWVALHNI